MDMSSEMFQKTIHSILSSTVENKVLIILHGGEPTILPQEWFEETLGKAYELAKLYNKKLEIAIQSNLIDISKNKLHIFRKHQVSIGGSLDNPDFLIESLRPLAKKALATYLKAKELGINIGILTTINYSNINTMKNFCNWLLNSLQIKHFKANVAYSVGTGIELFIPKAESIFNAQKDIIDFMLETSGALLEENLSQEIIRFFENYHAGKERMGTLCDDRRCGAGSKVIGITPEGNLLPCGRFAWNDIHYFLGNINSDDYTSGENFDKVNQFQELNPENWQHCHTCKAKDICGFGCQAFIVRSKAKYNIECEPTKLRFNYYQENIESLQQLYESICKSKQKTAMSRFDQKLSKLQKLVPQQYHVRIQNELTEELQNIHKQFSEES